MNIRFGKLTHASFYEPAQPSSIVPRQRDANSNTQNFAVIANSEITSGDKTYLELIAGEGQLSPTLQTIKLFFLKPQVHYLANPSQENPGLASLELTQKVEERHISGKYISNSQEIEFDRKGDSAVKVRIKPEGRFRPVNQVNINPFAVADFVDGIEILKRAPLADELKTIDEHPSTK